jgi:thiamine pyrophosphokinase
LECLVVAGSPAPKDIGFYRDLLAEATDLIAADGGAALCLAQGRAPDLVVGDFDSLGDSELSTLQDAGIELERHPAEKDATDLDLALAAAIRRGHTEVTVTACLGGRLDHTLGVIGSLTHHEASALELLEPEVSGWLVGSSDSDPDAASVLELSGRGSIVSVFALSEGVRVSLVGFEYPLHSEPLPVLSTRGVSNVITSSTFASMTAYGGRVLVLSPRVHDLRPARRARAGREVV